MAERADRLLDELREQGFRLRISGDRLMVHPKPDEEASQRIRDAKKMLVFMIRIEEAGDRQRRELGRLDSKERGEIKRLFLKFRKQHGDDLLAADWNRQVVFGMNRPDCVTHDEDMADVMRLLLADWVLMDIAPDRLIFERSDQQVAWLRSGKLDRMGLE